ncbi:MAG: polysaccharide biosynthesis tyrosine autokinase [Nitrococcus sp.]|nr:polysaccharide biosynthesis tyrosine autokinase [Nitrococcus sp.]
MRSQPARPELEEFDLRSTLLALRRRAGMIAAIVVCGTALTIVAAILLPEKYTASAEVLVNSSQERLLEVGDVNNAATVDAGYVDSQVEILRSTSLMERVANELGLSQDPEFNPYLEDSSSLLEFFDLSRWFPSLKENESSPNQNAVKSAIIDTLLSKSSASREELTFVIAVTATSKSPEKAAKIANEIVEQYVAGALTWRMNSLKRTREWLHNQIEERKEELVVSEKAVENFRAQNNLLTVAGETLNAEQRSQINEQLVLARAELSAARARYQHIESVLSSTHALTQVARLLSSELMVQLRQQRAELIQEQANLASRYEKRHPQMVDIAAQIGDVEQQIEAEAERIVETVKHDIAVAHANVQALQESIQSLGKEAAENNQAEVQLRALERKAEANRQLYESLLDGYERAVALTSNNNSLEPIARAVSAAMPPRDPSFPKVPVFAAVGFVFFGLTGVGTALVLGASDTRIYTRSDVEEKLGLRHIASFPIVSREELRKEKVRAVHEYVIENPRSLLAIAHERCKATLELSVVERPVKLVAIGSSLPGEGKTTFATCLARVMARSGLKTLVIDADLRKASLTKLFSLSGHLGLLDVLEGRVNLERAVVRDDASGLHLLVNGVYLLADGVTLSNPTDLLRSEAMRSLLRVCREQYDFVILDTAPVLPFLDTPVLLRELDTMVFLIRSGKTSDAMAEDALRTILDYGGHVLGAGLTMASVKKQARYSYGYYY